MPYALRDDVSFCWVDGRPVFLDLRDDRYFQLPISMERTFIACLEDPNGVQNDPTELLERDILVAATSDAIGLSAVSVERASYSAFEQPPSEQTVGLAVLLEVLAIVWLTALQMKMRTLKDVLASLDVYRRHRTEPPILNSPMDSRLSHAAIEFMRARLYVPVEMVCLLDSLSMVRFLANRGLHANIVFGVACDPFSAHCWVQTKNWVLNDTVGNTNAHTPIRVV